MEILELIESPPTELDRMTWISNYSRPKDSKQRWEGTSEIFDRKDLTLSFSETKEKKTSEKIIRSLILPFLPFLERVDLESFAKC